MRGMSAAVFGALLLTMAAVAADRSSSLCLRSSAAATTPDEPALAEQVDEARRSLLAHPEQADLAGRLGMILHAYELLEPARACYAEAIELDAQSVRWRYYRAVVLAALGRVADASAEIDRVLAVKPQQPVAVMLRAELLALSGAVGRSESAWRQAVALAPERSVAHYGLGRALASLGRDSEAIIAFRRAIEIDAQPQARYGLALAYRRTGRAEEAAKALAAYRALDLPAAPSPANPWMDEVWALNRSVRNQVSLGVQFAREGRVEEAIETFNAVLKTSPDLAVAHANLVALYARTGEQDKAAEHYQRAVVIDPREADAHFNWAGALAQQGRWQEAAEMLERAVDAGPHFSQARLQLGQIYERLERPEDALEQYLQAAEGDPLNRDAQRLLGGALVEAGTVEEGLDALEKAVDVEDGRAAEYMEGLSRAHEEDGRLELALGYARRALRHDPGQELKARLSQSIERLEAMLEAAP